MGKFNNAVSLQDKLWAVVESEHDELAADGVKNIPWVVNELLCNGADANELRGEDGALQTPLSFAVEKGTSAIDKVKAIISSDAFVFNENTGLAVLRATSLGNIEVVDLLLSKMRQGGKPVGLDRFGEHGQSAYQIAIEDDHVSIAQLLLNHGAESHRVKDENLLKFALRTKQGMLVRAILADTGFKITFSIMDEVIHAIQAEEEVIAPEKKAIQEAKEKAIEAGEAIQEAEKKAIEAEKKLRSKLKLRFDFVIPDRLKPIFQERIAEMDDKNGGGVKNVNHLSSYQRAQAGQGNKTAIERLTGSSQGFDDYIAGFFKRAQNYFDPSKPEDAELSAKLAKAAATAAGKALENFKYSL